MPNENTFADDAGWLVVEDAFDPTRHRSQETVFSVGNGQFATRGSLDEGYRANWPATLAHGIFAPHPLAHSELANLPDWTSLDVHVGGERFSLESGTTLRHRRVLDLRHGLLRREVTWRSPAGRTVELAFERFVSVARPNVAVSRVTVIATDFDGPVEVHARLNARPETDGLAHTQIDQQWVADGIAALGVRIRGRDTLIGEAMRLVVLGADVEAEAWNTYEQPTLAARWNAQRAASATFEKTVVLITSRESSDPIDAALTELRSLEDADFDSLLGESEAAWRRDWAIFDIVIEGDPEAQVATRFALFQLLICAPRTDDDVSVGAKGLTGFGYRGHVFWDTDTFMLPVFAHTKPEIARNLLGYRYHRLPGARRKALGNGLVGAQFPWESAETGDEVTPTWLPDGTGRRLVRIWTGDIEIHISSMVARAVTRYWDATGDDAWMIERGAEMIIDSARFWVSRAEWKEDPGRYEFTDVIGPDEYHEHVDNNAYTNRFAAWHLRKAVDVAEWLAGIDPVRAKQLLGDDSQSAATLTEFRRVADAIFAGTQRPDGVLEQFQGYFGLREVDQADYAGRTSSLQAILGVEGVAETQIIKQPDVLMLAALLPETFNSAELVANYDYYDPRTDHTYGSSLGPGIQALLAARLGRVEEAYEHFLRAARVDLHDDRGNTQDGTHTATDGALWQAIVFGFAGVEFDGDEVRTTPNLPRHWSRLGFRLTHRGKVVEVDIHPTREPATHADIRGLIFDLDGVVTNTSEFHYLAWKRLADEEGLPFDRAANEALRGISRRQSLALLLGNRTVSVEQAEEMMARKNGYYGELIAKLSPADLLPGALDVIDEGRARGLKIALASASKNAREVVDRLGIAGRFDAICDGYSVSAPKPAPDLFLAAAQSLGLPPAASVVFEDAADGVAAAKAAGMMSVGIGPYERVGEADAVLTDGFDGVNLDAVFALLAAASLEPPL